MAPSLVNSFLNSVITLSTPLRPLTPDLIFLPPVSLSLQLFSLFSAQVWPPQAEEAEPGPPWASRICPSRWPEFSLGHSGAQKQGEGESLCGQCHVPSVSLSRPHWRATGQEPVPRPRVHLRI